MLLLPLSSYILPHEPPPSPNEINHVLPKRSQPCHAKLSTDGTQSHKINIATAPCHTHKHRDCTTTYKPSSNTPNHLCNHEEILNRKETGEAVLHRVKSKLDAIANQPFVIHHISLFSPERWQRHQQILVDLGFSSTTGSHRRPDSEHPDDNKAVTRTSHE